MGVLAIDENWTLPVGSQYEVKVTIQDMALYKTIFEPYHEKGPDIIKELTEIVHQIPLGAIQSERLAGNLRIALKLKTSDIEILCSTYPMSRRDYNWDRVWFQISCPDIPIVQIILDKLK